MINMVLTLKMEQGPTLGVYRRLCKKNRWKHGPDGGSVTASDWTHEEAGAYMEMVAAKTEQYLKMSWAELAVVHCSCSL